MRNYTKKGTNAKKFMQISLLLKKIWYFKDSQNDHFAMLYSSFPSEIGNLTLFPDKTIHAYSFSQNSAWINGEKVTCRVCFLIHILEVTI